LKNQGLLEGIFMKAAKNYKVLNGVRALVKKNNRLKKMAKLVGKSKPELGSILKADFHSISAWLLNKEFIQ
jgi:hypothetical protein